MNINIKIRITIVIVCVISCTRFLGDNIDWSLYENEIVPMRPRCEKVDALYPTHLTTVQALVTPYKKFHGVIGTPYDGLYLPPSWIILNIGPKYDLIHGVNLSWAHYHLQLASAGAENMLCRDIAIDSAFATFALCQLRLLFDDEEGYNECLQDLLSDYLDDIGKCCDDYDRNIIKAMDNITLDLDAYIAAYSGCAYLDDLIENWEEYWANLVTK
jgi:hypothetical protein